MGLGSVSPGEQRAWFLAVGLADNTVRIISLDPSVSILEQIMRKCLLFSPNYLLNDEHLTCTLISYGERLWCPAVLNNIFKTSLKPTILISI